MDPMHPQDKLLDSIAKILTIIDSPESEPIRSECHILKDGLVTIRDTLWASREVNTEMLPPFYMVCSQLCDAFNSQLSGCLVHGWDLNSVVVIGHTFTQATQKLRALFHALSTFLSIRYL